MARPDLEHIFAMLSTRHYRFPRAPPSLRAPSDISEITNPDIVDTDLPLPVFEDLGPNQSDDSSILSSAPSMMAYSFSDTSSELSALSRSPTPPSEMMITVVKKRPTPTKTKRTSYLISPPRSQGSSRASPCPDPSSSGSSSSAEDGERPSKRRRIGPEMHRETKRLDMEDLDDPAQQAELDRLLKALRTKKKIVVVAGAGISTSAGIPDFRSSNGLFQSLKTQNNMKSSGKDLFSANVYRDDDSTAQFHHMVRSLHKDVSEAKATPFHHLIARLAKEDRLLRLYSQNVDGIDTALPPLETQVPLPKKGPWPKTIQLHGGLTKMVCTKCGQLSDFDPDLFDGPQAPDCSSCEERDYARTEIAGKRSHGIGKLRPRLVLYDESNPDDEAIGSCTKADWRRRPDCILVVGTTLKIPGVKRIVKETCQIVRHHRDGLAVWINTDSEPQDMMFKDCWDLLVNGTSDQVAEQACLGRWDDPAEEDIQVLSQEEVKEAKARTQVSVVVNTPSKASRFRDVESLPSPVGTPKVKAVSAAVAQSPAKVEMPRRPSWLQTVMNRASEQEFDSKTDTEPAKVDTEDQLQTVEPATTKKAALTKATSTKPPAPRGRPPKNAPKRQPAQKKVPVAQVNGQINFPVAKKNTVALNGTKKAGKGPTKKLEPLTTSPSRENMPSPPQGIAAKRPIVA